MYNNIVMKYIIPTPDTIEGATYSLKYLNPIRVKDIALITPASKQGSAI
jgi:hypothetical protein